VLLYSLACLLLKEEFQRKGKYQLMAKQYVRDTVLLTGAAYLMEWVEGGVRAVRGGTVSALCASTKTWWSDCDKSYIWIRMRPANNFSTGAIEFHKS
jgi:hypothetical protein